MKLQLPLDKTHRLIRWANSISAFYGHPLYLVGSQITGKNQPADVDIVCPIPDDEFTLRYGRSSAWCDEGCTGLYTDVRWQWADDCLKRSISGMRETGLRVDFKVQPYCQFLGYGHVLKAFKPYRLDTRPSEDMALNKAIGYAEDERPERITESVNQKL